MKHKDQSSPFDTAYFTRLCKHDDPTVRVAAKRCLDAYYTDKWKSRFKRILLNELAWALITDMQRKI